MDPFDDHHGRHIPIPDADDHRPAYNRQSSSFQDYDNPQRYSQYDEEHHDYAVDPEAHRDSYYQPPYDPSPQDIPLLPRDPVRNPFYDSSEDFRASRQSFHPPPTEPTPAPDQQRSNSYQEALQHWVYDCPVPPKMLRNVPHVEAPGRDEFTHMKYTAATCDPADFNAERFQLRPQLFGVPRHTELMIVVTMYNEEDALFARTMHGVFKNIEYMCTLKDKHNGIWGPNGWKKIVVCIINDGRAQLNIRTRAVLTALGVYQHGFAFAKVNDKPVKAHIYEYTTRVNIKVKKGIVETTPGGLAVPVQLMFCLKENNQKKINSHRWAFSAFGEALKPNICVLLDAGTRPGDKSIYELWKAFELDPNCGGACGEIKAMLGKDGGLEKLANPLVAAQNFEYKMSNILDKPMESAFGFISVLPGAFSAYRLVALQNDAQEQGPLEKYFAGETNHETANIFTKNMYLAEDRILCFELVAKRKASWVLTYVCTASGETDVPEKMPELIKQRRRWLNGSFFAAVYALWHSPDIFRSSHSFLHKMMFLLEFFYQLISMVFAWFAVGNFFLVFQILTTSLGDPNLLGRTGVILSVIVEWIYLGSLVACFVLSLGNTPDGSKRFYYSMVYSWGLIMIYLMFASIFITYKSVRAEAADGHFTISKLVTNSIFFTLIVSLLSTYVLWIFISIVFLDPWHIVTSSIQYLLLSPTYTNVINVYAFCNTHDVTWGTKGDDVEKEDINGNAKAGKKADEELGYDDAELDDLYNAALQKFSTEFKEPEKKLNAKAQGEADTRSFRTNIVLVWMFCNAALVAIVLKTGGVNRLSLKQTTEGESQQVKIYLSVVLWSVAGLSGFKFIGAMWYKIKRIFKR